MCRLNQLKSALTQLLPISCASIRFREPALAPSLDEPPPCKTVEIEFQTILQADPFRERAIP
jgi:hypothetical protein